MGLVSDNKYRNQPSCEKFVCKSGLNLPPFSRPRIVMSTFLPNPEWRVFKKIYHVDRGDDNSLENLRWSTVKMNRTKRKSRSKPYRRKWRFLNTDTKKCSYFQSKEELETAVKVYQEERWQKFCIEAIMDMLILQTIDKTASKI